MKGDKELTLLAEKKKNTFVYYFPDIFPSG
jgi:hypothetical protein